MEDDRIHVPVRADPLHLRIADPAAEGTYPAGITGQSYTKKIFKKLLPGVEVFFFFCLYHNNRQFQGKGGDRFLEGFEYENGADTKTDLTVPR